MKAKRLIAKVLFLALIINVVLPASVTEPIEATESTVLPVSEEELTKETFTAKLAEAKQMNKTGYTDSSWNILQSAITTANGIDVVTASTTDIKKALLQLFRAMEGMKQLPHLSDISVDGQKIVKFRPFRTEYTIYRDEALNKDTEITWTVSEGMACKEKRDIENKTVTLTVKDSDEQETVYNIRVLKKVALQSDNFENPDASKNIWYIYNEKEEMYSLEDGSLNIQTQNTPGDWYASDETEDIQNIFYQPALGDWESVTEIKFSEIPTKAWQGMGVKITDGNDRQNYLWFRFECAQDDTNTTIALRREVNNVVENIMAPDATHYNGQYFAIAGTDITADSTIRLKVVKAGEAYTFSYSIDTYKGGAYQEYATINAYFYNPTFALAAFNSRAVPSITAKFNSVEFTNVDINAEVNDPVLDIDTDSVARLYLAEDKYFIEGMKDTGTLGDNAEHPNNLGYMENDGNKDVCALYNINVEKAGYYNVTPRYSSGSNTEFMFKFAIEVDEAELAGWQATTGTGGFNKWVELNSGKVYLPAGRHQLKLNINYAENKANLYDMTFAYDAEYTAYATGQKYIDYRGTIAKVNKYQETDYSQDQDGWKAFEEAYLKAFLAEKNGQQTAEAILTDVTTGLKTAEKNLVADSYKAAKGELQTYVSALSHDAANYSAENGYSSDSWETYTKALAEAQDKLTNEPEYKDADTTVVLEKLLANLQAAEKMLVTSELGDTMTSLKTTIAAIEAKENEYPQGTWESFENTELKAAKTALRDAETNPSATVVAELKNTLTVLETKISAMETKVDIAFRALQSEVEASKDTYEKGMGGKVLYTTGWDAFKIAYETAKAALDAGKASKTEAQLIAFKNNLVAAKADLATDEEWNAAKADFTSKLAEADAVYTNAIVNSENAIYTSTTWTDFIRALEKAKDLNTEESQSMSQLTSTTTGLTTAIANLKRVDDVLTQLVSEIETEYLAEDKKSTYTEASVKKLAAEVAYAKTDGLTLAQKEQSIVELDKLVDSLVIQAEYDAHKAAYDALYKVYMDATSDTTEYIEDANWKVYRGKYSEAETLLSSVTRNEEPNYMTVDISKFEAAAETLTDAKANLITKAWVKLEADFTDAKDALQTTVNTAKAKIEAGQETGNYTDASWLAFEEAYKEATAGMETTEISQVSVTTLQGLLKALTTAETNLKGKEVIPVINPVEEARKEMVEIVSKTEQEIGTEQGDYTDDSWQKYQEALAAAKNPSANITTEDIKKLREALQAAVGSLKTKTQVKLEADFADAKDALQTTVNTAKAKIEAGQETGNYTDASWLAFEEAYQKAVAGMATTEITQMNVTTLQDLFKELTLAETNLKEKPKEEPKEAPKEEESNAEEPKVEEPKVDVTEDESEIMDQLGVTVEEAKQIALYAQEYGVTKEELFVTEAYVTSLKTEGDVKGSTFGKVFARNVKQTTTTLKLKWNKVKGASGYLVYGARCGKKDAYTLLKDVQGNKKTTYTQNKLNKGMFYKYIVVPYKQVGNAKMTLAVSKTVHTVTKGGKYDVAKAIEINTAKVTLKKGGTFRINASEVKTDKKIKTHRKIAYESSNIKVATVKKGKMKAVGKGKCKIYVYAQNGTYKTIVVTVK